jgi:ribonuclease VapC
MQDVTVRVDKLGRILLPASVRKEAGLEPNTRLVVRVHEGRVELMTMAGAVRMAQAIVRRHVKAGTGRRSHGAGNSAAPRQGRHRPCRRADPRAAGRGPARDPAPLMSAAVIDASAVLALLNDEPGSDRVATALTGASINAVNLSEVLGRLRRRGVSSEASATAVGCLGLDVIPFDRELAADVAELELVAGRLGLSLGDRACLATARRMRRPAITADRAWLRLDVGVRIIAIR